MKEYNTINIWQKFKQPENDQNNLELRAMRHLDHNIILLGYATLECC
jgi:hypothetical protein